MRENELLEWWLKKGQMTGHFELPSTATDDDLRTVLGLVAERKYQVNSLHLADTRVGDAGVQALAASPSLAALEKLDLGGARVGDAGVQALAASPSLAALKGLHLDRTQVGDAGVQALAASPLLTALEQLGLFSTRVGDAGVRALAASPFLAALESLVLSGTQVGDAGVQALAASPSLTALKGLYLDQTKVGDAGVQALAASPSLAALEWLKLDGTRVGDAGVEALAASPSLAVLHTLSLGGTQVSLPERLKHSEDASTILQFYREARLGRTLLEVKVPILGLGRSGKTLLGRHLAPRDDCEKNSPFLAEQESTHAFESRSLDLAVELGGDSRTCCARLFDFGGQPEMHGAHRFFLADQRNVYLVLVSARKDRMTNRLDYWLGMVRHYGRGAPAVVVVTHCDDQPAAGDRFLPLPNASTHRRMEVLNAENLSKLHRIPIAVVDGYSNCTANNLQAVRDALTRAIAKLGAIFDVKFPKGLFQVKDWLEGRSPRALSAHPTFDTYLPVNSFRKACVACGQEDRAQQDIWLKLLRDMGVVHWVGDRPEVQRNAEHALADYFFHPEWVKKPVYDVVRDSTAIRGIISQARLDEVLKKSGVKRDLDRRRVTALMLVCELCFKVQGVDEKMVHYLVVDQVPAKSSGVELSWPLNPRKRLFWQFDFLPDHLLTQLLGRWFPWRDKKLDTYHRDEIVLRSRDAEKCRLRLTARPASHLLELEYHAERDQDWRRMHAKIESEIEFLLDPEGLKLWASEELWREIDPQKEPQRTLTDEEKIITGELTEELLRITGVPFEYQEELGDRLRERFLKSLELKQPSPRLAYRACYVVSCAMNLASLNGLDEGFPLPATKNTAVQVGHWVNSMSTIKELLQKSVGKELTTLERGDGEQPFDSLRKAYGKAVAELRKISRNA